MSAASVGARTTAPGDRPDGLRIVALDVEGRNN
jgi:hypothetical protein